MLKYVEILFVGLILSSLTASSQVKPVSVTSVDPSIERLQQEQLARIFAQRQAQLRIDTAKLVALTAELKQQVDKANVNILSLDVVKKAEEIQKLAKSVQDKMKNAY